jgi:hypothetical protein
VKIRCVMFLLVRLVLVNRIERRYGRLDSNTPKTFRPQGRNFEPSRSYPSRHGGSIPTVLT